MDECPDHRMACMDYVGSLPVALTVLSLWLLVLNLSHPDVPVYHFTNTPF